MDKPIIFTDDYIFKGVFREKDRLKNFLIGVLVGEKKMLPEGSQILSIHYDKNEEIQEREQSTAKKVVFDLRVKTNQGIFIIEMQKIGSDDYIKRANFYASMAHGNQKIKSPNKASHKDYRKAVPVIVVSMIGNKVFNDEIPCLSYHITLEKKTLQNVMGEIAFVCVELEKFEDPKYDQSNINDDMKEWFHLFKNNDMSAHYKNPHVNHAIEYAHYVQENEYDKYTRHQMSIIANEEDARAEGIKIGKKEGREEGKIEIAKSMLSDGHSVELVSKYTGLPIEKLKSLK
jgi:predicted transposase/invertase (TIGR01784 family)